MGVTRFEFSRFNIGFFLSVEAHGNGLDNKSLIFFSLFPIPGGFIRPFQALKLNSCYSNEALMAHSLLDSHHQIPVHSRCP
jgi:hypothetical protein